MNRASRSLAIVALTCGCAAPLPRAFNDGVFVSAAHPPMRVRIEPGFEYLGPESFLLGDGGTHAAERHHWVRRRVGDSKGFSGPRQDPVIRHQVSSEAPHELVTTTTGLVFGRWPWLVIDDGAVALQWSGLALGIGLPVVAATLLKWQLNKAAGNAYVAR